MLFLHIFTCSDIMSIQIESRFVNTDSSIPFPIPLCSFSTALHSVKPVFNGTGRHQTTKKNSYWAVIDPHPIDFPSYFINRCSASAAVGVIGSLRTKQSWNHDRQQLSTKFRLMLILAAIYLYLKDIKPTIRPMPKSLS